MQAMDVSNCQVSLSCTTPPIRKHDPDSASSVFHPHIRFPFYIPLDLSDRSFSKGIKRPEREADYAPPSRPYVFMAWCLSMGYVISMAWGQFYLYPYGWFVPAVRVLYPRAEDTGS
jgi:hypothetical protein